MTAAAVSAGSLLREAREARGLTLEQAASATRVRVPYLAALEEDAPERLPAPVYARGYLKLYAALLELDAEPLLASLRRGPRDAERTVRSHDLARPRWRPALTPGLALAGGLGLLVAGLGAYAHHELSLETVAATRPPPVLIASPPPASPAASPARAGAAVPAPAAVPARPGAHPKATVTVSLRFTAPAWVLVVVDGRQVYGANGRFFAAGDEVSFTGKSISVTSGKGAATVVSVDGEEVGPLPDGVTTRQYTPQT